MSLAALLALLTAANETLKIVLASQPPEVQKAMWERHMALTEPLFLVANKLAEKVDTQIDPKAVTP